MGSDNESLEPLFNDKLSDDSGTIGKRDLRFKNASNPIDGYHISDQEVGTTSFFGYLNSSGNWYIQKAVRAGAIVTYTYTAASSGYNFSNRASETYASFSDTF